MTTDEVTQLITAFGRPHFMPLYWNDFFSDDLVQVMELEELGAYMKLLQHAWMATPANTIPGDNKRLAIILGIPLSRWRKIASNVLACFSVLDDGRYFQKRQREVMVDVLRNIRDKKERAASGGRAKAEKERLLKQNSSSPEEPARALPEHCSSNANQSQSQKKIDPPTPLEESGGESQAVKDLGNRLAAGKTLAGFPVFDVFKKEALRLNSDWKETDVLRLFQLGQTKPIKSWKAWLNQCAANAKKR